MGKEIEIKVKIENVNEVISWLSNNAIFDRDVFLRRYFIRLYSKKFYYRSKKSKS